RGDGGGVARWHVELLAIWRHGRTGDPLRKAFVVDERHVESTESIGTAGSIEILAAVLYLQDFRLNQRIAELIGHVAAGMLVAYLQLRAAGKMLLESLRISNRMQRAADHGLWFVLLGDDNRFKTAGASRDPAIFAHEIRIVRALHQQLGHDG